MAKSVSMKSLKGTKGSLKTSEELSGAPVSPSQVAARSKTGRGVTRGARVKNSP
jgi:hypothetical protein